MTELESLVLDIHGQISCSHDLNTGLSTLAKGTVMHCDCSLSYSAIVTCTRGLLALPSFC